jgi:hypothetical protein
LIHEFAGYLNLVIQKEESVSDVAHYSQAPVTAATARHGADLGASLSGMFAALGALAFLGALIAAGADSLDYQLNLIDLEGQVSEATLVGSAVALGVVFLAFLFGGWVAGRMAQFDGGINGLGAGLWLLVLAAIFALLGALVGPEFNAFGQAGLPDWFSSIRSDVRTPVAFAILAAFIAVVLAGGYLGGRAGEAFNGRSVSRRSA